MWILQYFAKSQAFYQRRIPIYAWQRFALRIFLVLLTLATSVLARYEMGAWVVLVTSGIAAVTSWVEFTEVTLKIQRYSRATRSFKKLLNWWDSLDEVEKASTETISTLILRSEAIIADERTAWMSTQFKPGEEMLEGARVGRGQIEGDEEDALRGGQKGKAAADPFSGL